MAVSRKVLGATGNAVDSSHSEKSFERTVTGLRRYEFMFSLVNLPERPVCLGESDICQRAFFCLSK